MDWLELKKEFRKLAERKQEWPNEWFYVLTVFDRIGAFHLNSKAALARECDQTLARVQAPELRGWIEAVKDKATS